MALITLLPTPDGTLLTLGLSGDPAGRCPSHQVFIREFSSSLALAQTPTINIHSAAHFHHPWSYYNPSEMLLHTHHLSLTELRSTIHSCLGRHTHIDHDWLHIYMYVCMYLSTVFIRGVMRSSTFVYLLTNSRVSSDLRIL